MKKLFIVLFLLLIIPKAKAQSIADTVDHNKAYKHFPDPVGFVNDFANIIPHEDEQKLETKLRNFERQSSNQIVIILIDTSEVNDHNFDDYALTLSNAWGVGTKEKNNGLTIIVAPKLRKVRISTGEGIEHILTNETCNTILQSFIIPEFKQNNYYKGLNDGVDEIIRRLE